MSEFGPTAAPSAQPTTSASPYGAGAYGRPPGSTPPARRKRWIWIALGLVGVAFVLWLIYANTQPAQQGGFGGPGGGGRGGAGGGGRGGRGGAGRGGMPTAVNAARAVQGDIPIYLNSLGTVTPLQTVTVRTQISGQLIQVAFREGQMVTKGQFLAQIDPRPYQQALAQAQGTLGRDQALLANAKIDLNRYQTLLAQDSIAKQQVDTQAATVRQDEAVVASDTAAVNAQKLNLAYCHIVSPVTGRIGLRQVDQGNYVTAGDANGLVVVTQINPITVLFTVPEDTLPKVAARLRQGAVLPVTAYDRTQTTPLAQGKLSTLDNQIDTTTGTVRAKAEFGNGDQALFPNQFVNVRVTVDTLKNVVVAPTAAVLKGNQGMFVYAVQKGRGLSSVAVTPVTVGPAAGENTAILTGLQAGTVVVTDGSDRLKDAGRVILPGDCIPAGMGYGRGGRGGAGGGGGTAGAASGGGSAGGYGGGAAAKPSGGFFGLFAKKPAADPMAALRCKPGEHPHSLMSGGAGGYGGRHAGGYGGGAGGFGGAAPAPGATTTTTTSSTVATHTHGGAASPAPSAAEAPAPQPTPRGAEGGGGGGGRMQAMLGPLNLDAGQQAKAQAIFAQAREQAMASDDPRAGFRAAMEGAFNQLNAILRPDQRAKLVQVRAEMARRRAEREAGGGGGPDQ